MKTSDPSLIQLPMYPGYAVDPDEGEVVRRGRALRATANGQVTLSIGGTKDTVNVSWLVWSAVEGELPASGITHRNGNPSDSRINNLVASGGRHKPTRRCSKGHLLLASECCITGYGNRICRRCYPHLPLVLPPRADSYSIEYGVGRAPQNGGIQNELTKSVHVA